MSIASKKVDLKSINYLFKTLIKLLGSDINKKTENFFYEKLINAYAKKTYKARASKLDLLKLFVSFIIMSKNYNRWALLTIML